MAVPVPFLAQPACPLLLHAACETAGGMDRKVPGDYQE